MASTQQTFSLRPMVEADVPRCARIAGEAFKSDRHTQLKAADPKGAYNHEEGMLGLLTGLVARTSGTSEGTVAVDDTTSEILGWVAWGFRGFNSPEAEAQRKKNLETARPETHPPAPSPPVKAELDTDPSLGVRRRLETYTSTDMQNWMAHFMPPGTKCMFIISIIVAPASQGRGVGTALMRHGTRRADAEGVFCWVHASEAGAPVFLRLGYKQVGMLQLDLDEWNTQGIVPPEGEGHPWGKYTLRYLRREPGALDG